MRRAALLLALSCPVVASGADATFTVKVLTPETALKAARAALESCRKRGFQVSVAVTDRMGVLQVLLRDRFAGPHTPDMASAKAYTAASFRTNTTELAEATQPGRPASGIRNRPGVAAVGGDSASWPGPARVVKRRRTATIARSSAPPGRNTAGPPCWPCW